MKKYIIALLFCLSCSFVSASEMSVEKQQEIIENYMFLTGQLSQSQATAFEEETEMNQLSGKCGMSIIREFKFNYDKFDKQLIRSTGVQLATRPDYLSDTVSSPSGNFLIHFTTVGDDAVYNNVAGGSLGYIDSVGLIMDDVYEHIVTTLGYPEPIRDSFYVAGGDEKYDVYLYNLQGAYYGLAYTDSVLEIIDSTVFPSITRVTATAFLELDNDYFELNQYKDRPLDAVRVTAAHEFFHMVQFAIDAAESEKISNVIVGPAWMEMSAVWMEEEIYDNINDYYNYLPFFFNDPSNSIQQFDGPGDLHPYASGIFPMFLSQKFDRDIIKSIWTKCGEYGKGPHFLRVTAEVVDSATSGSESYESMFGEFALWNYFTGSRSGLAPAGVGYSEKDFYVPEFSDELETGSIAVEFSYPEVVFGTDNWRSPDNNASFYLTLLHTDKLTEEYACYDTIIVSDTTYWICNSGAFPSCTDSTEVTALDAFDIIYVDTVCTDSALALNFILSLDPNFADPWSGSIIYRYKEFPDSIDVDTLQYPAAAGIGLKLRDPQKYSSISLIFSPASSNRGFYSPAIQYGVGYGVLNAIILDSVNVNVPAAIFYPYPNPAVIGEMSGNVVNFKFQYPTDSTGFPIHLGNSLIADPYMVVDIYNINGEHLRSIDRISDAKSDKFAGLLVSEWDMKNESGADVVSGVYLAYARVFEGSVDGKLLVEERTKIAVIR